MDSNKAIFKLHKYIEINLRVSGSNLEDNWRQGIIKYPNHSQFLKTIRITA